MNLTVISRTVLGFSVVVLLMTLLAATSFYVQQQSSSAYTETAESLLPTMKRSYELAIYAQNANKAVSQHASALDASQRRQLEQAFQAAVEQYKVLNDDLQGSLGDKPLLRDKLVIADGAFRQAFLIGRKQIEARNQLIQTRDNSRLEIQNYTARWITFSDEREAAIVLAGNLGLVENFAVSVIADSLTLAQTTLGGVSNIENLELLNNIKSKLSESSIKTVSRIEKLEKMAPDSAEKLKPFADFLDYSVNDANGYLSLQIQLVSLNEAVDQNLAQMGGLINQGAESLSGLSREINNLVMDTNHKVEASFASNLWMTVTLFVIALLVSVVIVFTQIRSIKYPLKSINRALSLMSEGDLKQDIDLKNRDEFGEIASGINLLAQKLGGLLAQIKQSSATLSQSSQGALVATQRSDDMLENQKFQTGSVATAVTEMEAAVVEVARSAESSLSEILVIRDLASQGKGKMDSSIVAITELDNDIKLASKTITEMKQESENIESILEVITGIAEQTNLLALNAAIEAARAGEQGRGFAVVADEVRNLASKTQNSTEEIYKMIESLQKIASNSVDIMNKNSEAAKAVVDNSTQAADSLNDIASAIESVASMSEHIASAAQEQSHVSKEITENVVSISDSAEDIYQLSQNNKHTFTELMALSEQQAKMTEQFKM